MGGLSRCQSPADGCQDQCGIARGGTHWRPLVAGSGVPAATSATSDASRGRPGTLQRRQRSAGRDVTRGMTSSHAGRAAGAAAEGVRDGGDCGRGGCEREVRQCQRRLAAASPAYLRPERVVRIRLQRDDVVVKREEAEEALLRGHGVEGRAARRGRRAQSVQKGRQRRRSHLCHRDAARGGAAILRGPPRGERGAGVRPEGLAAEEERPLEEEE